MPPCQSDSFNTACTAKYPPITLSQSTTHTHTPRHGAVYMLFQETIHTSRGKKREREIGGIGERRAAERKYYYVNAAAGWGEIILVSCD